MKRQFLYLLLIYLYSSGVFAEEYSYTLLTSTGAVRREVRTASDFEKFHVQDQILSAADLQSKFPSLAKPSKIALIGDSGCRLKESALKRSYQDCTNPKKWPYPRLIQNLAQEKPDLLIHLGDYHYREQCSAGRPCQKMSPTVGYGWEPWKLDFFDPSKKSLKQFPWLIVRGNHEDCQRAFLGYKTLLRTTEWKQTCDEIEEPQLITLGSLAILNLDSSSLTDMPDFSEATQNKWKILLSSLDEKIKKLQVSRIWLVTHKPIYGLVRMAGAFAPLNINLRKFFENATWSNKIELIFAGHIHNSQVTKAKNFPLQIVLGNGGTALDSSKTNPTEENLSALNYEKARFIDHDFGYVLMTELQTTNPKIEFHSASGKLNFSCHIQNKGEDCF